MKLINYVSFSPSVFPRVSPRPSPRDKIANISDSVIIVQNVDFKVHKALLSMESDVFHAMFSSELLEARSGRVEINDVDPEVFDEFLHFIYTKTSPRLSQFPLQLMELADRYMVHHLLGLCEEFLEGNVDESIVCDSVIVSHRLNRRDLKYNLFAFVRKHLSEIVKRDDWKKVEADFDLMTELCGSFPKLPLEKHKIKPSPVGRSKWTRVANWSVLNNTLREQRLSSFLFRTLFGDFTFRLYAKMIQSRLNARLVVVSKPRRFPVLLRCNLMVLDPRNNSELARFPLSYLWTSELDEIHFEVMCKTEGSHRSYYSGDINICMDIMDAGEVPRAKSQFKEKDRLSKYYDVSFLINSRVFNGHRAILAGKSQFFYELFENPDLLAEPHYVLTETTEEVFEIILDYLYTNEIPTTELTNLELLKCAHLFELRDLYTELELHCVKNVTVENAIPSLIVAHHVDSERIREEAVDIISKHLKSLANSKDLWWQLSPFPQLITTILIQLRENLALYFD